MLEGYIVDQVALDCKFEMHVGCSCSMHVQPVQASPAEGADNGSSGQIPCDGLVGVVV